MPSKSIEQIGWKSITGKGAFGIFTDGKWESIIWTGIQTKPETKMKTKEERKQAAWDACEKIRDAALDAYKKKVKEIDDEDCVKNGADLLEINRALKSSYARLVEAAKKLKKWKNYSENQPERKVAIEEICAALAAIEGKDTP